MTAHTPTPIPDRLARLDTLTLADGAHSVDDPDAAVRDGQACVMEAVAWVAGEPWSDAPECASPVLGAYLRTLNDDLPDDERQRLRQYVPRLVGSRGTPEQEDARAWMAMDWLVRVHAPAWLRLAGLEEHADRLAGLDELRAGMDVPSIRPAIDAARKDAAAAWNSAWTAAWTATRDATRDVAWTAVKAAAWDAANAAANAARAAASPAAASPAAANAAANAAVDAAWTAAWTAAGAATGAATGTAAWTAAGAAALDALRPTRVHLIDASHQLVDRMLAVTEARR